MKIQYPEKINFNQLADSYADAAVVARTTAEILVERLMCWKSLPVDLLDLGTGTGFVTELLLSLRDNMHIHALDCADHMLAQVPNSQRVTKVLSNARSMPCRDNQFDAVIANMVLPWCAHWPVLFSEVKRVLKPGGLLLFSTLSPYTWSSKIEWEDVGCWRDLPTMEQVGDALAQQGFHDTVLDNMRLSFAFEDTEHLKDAMLASGWLVSEPKPQEYQQPDVRIDLEIVFGHAVNPLSEQGEYRISADNITFRS